MLKYNKYNRNLKTYSRDLRKNMTEAEKLLWSRLRGRQLKNRQFYRQKTIGNYIVDFYCPKADVIIELDGGQHYTEDGKAEDKIRDGYLSSVGIKVLRFSDVEALTETNSVLEKIWSQL